MKIRRRFYHAVLPALMIGLCGCSTTLPQSTLADFSHTIEADAERTEEFLLEIEEDAQELKERQLKTSEPDPQDTEPHSYIRLTVPDSGFDIFTPASPNGHDYRYGPSLLYNDDGSIDAWFSFPGDGRKEYDWVVYKHTEDGGATWTASQTALSPTPNTLDTMSICDPDVFWYDGYYYMGYTSTTDNINNGFCNSVFLARSENPAGPYEKWDGEGFGGNPKPLVYHDGSCIAWGVGEPSFVVVDDTLYIYTTKDSFTEDYERIRTTQVHTADLTDEDWPSHLTFRGYAVNRTDTTDASEADYIYNDCDSWDVVYVEESGTFLALCTNRRFSSNSCLLYYESRDGISFERISELNTNIICGAHNCGVMGDKSGHIKPGDPAFLGYAYAGAANREWGRWATRMTSFTIDYTEEPDRSEEGCENLKTGIAYSSRAAEAGGSPMMITANRLINKGVAGGNPFDLRFYWVDCNRTRFNADPAELSFSGYDPEILKIEEGKIWPLSPGYTQVTVHYGDLSRKIFFAVLETEGLLKSSEAASMGSVPGEYTISLSDPYATAVRPFARLANGETCELFNEKIVKHKIWFESEDPSICTVEYDGMIKPVSTGDTLLCVYCHETGLSYGVPVHVIE
ncbi:MAG: exo-alpha-sialidase [Lachnospiraceae bacterium]|nr:exo-alpha-sialidase [Lachnospiraceae bacterium]